MKSNFLTKFLIFSSLLSTLIFSLVTKADNSKDDNNESPTKFTLKRDFVTDFALEFSRLSQDPDQNQNQNPIQATNNHKGPLGENKSALPPECHPQFLENNLLINYQNPNQFAQNVKNYFAKCSEYLHRGQTRGLAGLIEFSMTNYDVSKNAKISKQTLKISDGSAIEAYVGVQDMFTKRPWIIAKCGVFCDVTSSPSSLNYMMNYFDQSPFNVIFLSNHTGSGHIQKNAQLTIGGFHEVYDLYDAAEWLKYDSPYKETVDSIHAAGFSLGGSSAMAVSHLSNSYRSRNGRPLFSSTSAICPVVNLGETLNDMYGKTTKGNIFTRLTWQSLKEAAPYLSLAQDYFSSGKRPPQEIFPLMLSDIGFRYGHHWEQLQPPNRNAPPTNSIEELLKFNTFSIDTDLVNIPTLAWASHDDHVVSFALNTKTLIEKNKNLNLGALGLDYGDHCGFSTSYGFQATTAVLQSFVLSHSPNFKKLRHLVSVKYPELPPLLLMPMEQHLRQWWVVEPNASFASLKYETFSSSWGLNCRFADPYSSDSNCRRTLTQKIPLQIFSMLGLESPKNQTEAEIISRKLNGLIRVSNANEPIDGTQNIPTNLTWYEF